MIDRRSFFSRYSRSKEDASKKKKVSKTMRGKEMRRRGSRRQKKRAPRKSGREREKTLAVPLEGRIEREKKKVSFN